MRCGAAQPAAHAAPTPPAAHTRRRLAASPCHSRPRPRPAGGAYGPRRPRGWWKEAPLRPAAGGAERGLAARPRARRCHSGRPRSREWAAAVSVRGEPRGRERARLRPYITAAARAADVFRIGVGARAPARPRAAVRLFRMSRNVQRLRDHDTNPCIAETDASRHCMEDNNYRRDMCTSYFLKYKNCRKFWHAIMIQRRKDGVKPNMPAAEERENILKSMGRTPY